MDFSMPERVKSMVSQVRAFMDEVVYPLEQRFGQRGGSFKAIEPELRAARQKARTLGLWTPQIAKEHGGAGLSLVEHARLSEELGRSPLGHYCFNCQAPDAGNMEILVLCGTDEQKARWLGPLIRGEIRSCFSMTEPEVPGSNPTWLQTTAVREGDEWVINGHKWFTTAADGAAFAIVMAVTDPDAKPHARASQIIVPTDTSGFNLVRNISVMGHAGDGWASHSEIVYENCRVPAGNLLGAQGTGFLIAQERLGAGRIHHCMRWIGIAERCFDLLCRRAATRQMSPGKVLGTKQIVQEWIAESRAEINAARLSILHAAWKIENEGLYAAREEVSTIKFYVAGVLGRVIDRAVQAHGALGITDDTVLASFYRHERAARIYDGADEVHKVVVARRILKQYGVDV